MRLSVPDLLPNRGYAIQVRAVNSDLASEWSPRYSLQTVADTVLPTTPVNVTWAVSGDSFAASWDAVTTNANNDPTTIVRYEIEVSNGGTTKIIAIPQTTASSVLWTLPFEDNRSFFGTPKATVGFRVRAVDTTDLKSSWTVLLSATNPAPGAPTAVTAVGGLNQVSLSWTPPADVDIIGYNVYIGASLLTYTAATSYIYNTTTYSSTTLTVKSVDKFGQESTGANSNAVTPTSPFITDTTAPAIPTALAATITNNANGIGARAAVSWTMASPPSDLAGYYVRYRKVGDTNYSNVSFTKDVLAGTIELQSAYTNYEFQIKAFDWSNNESAWSSTVTATSPSNAVPSNIASMTAAPGRDSIVYTWTPVTDADLDTYEVTFSTSATFASGNITYKTGNAATLTVSGLTPATTYYARVRAQDIGGLTSASWSATNTTATTTFPLSDGSAPASSPTPTVTGGIGYLFVNWTPVTNNDGVTYEVHVSTTTGFTPSAGTKVGETDSTIISLEKDGAGTALAYGTTYYVKLIAKDRDGSAAAGAQGSGTIAKVAAADSSLTAVDVGAPANGDNTGGTNLFTRSRDFATSGTFYYFIGASGVQAVASTAGPFINSAGSFPNVNAIRLTNNAVANNIFRIREVKQLGWHTVSFWYKRAGVADTTFNVDVTDQGVTTFTATSAWQKGTFSANVTTLNTTYNFADFEIPPSGDIYIYQPMLEIGRLASAYAPSPEEVLGDTTNAVATSASGKNKITYATTAPVNGTNTGVLGDTWFVRDATTLRITAQYELTTAPSTWTSRLVDGVIIANLDAGVITSGFINSARIQAGTITATKLNVTVGGGNEIPNSSAENSAIPEWAGNGTTLSSSTDRAYHGSRSFKVVTNNVNQEYYPQGPMIAARPLTTMTLSSYVYSANARNIRTYVNQYNVSAGLVASTPGPTYAVVANTWTRIKQTITLDATTVNAQIYPACMTTTSGASETYYFDAVQWEEGDVTTAYSPKTNEILPGTVTANMMVANTITAASGIIADAAITTAKIADASITSAKIISLTASSITSGTVSANTIQIASTGSVQSTNYVTGTTGWKLSTSGLEIVDGAVKASTLTAGTIGSSTGIIQVAAGASIVMNGGYLKSNTYTGTAQSSNPSGAGFYLGNDGLRIDTGMVSAAAITTSTLSAATITLGSTGIIQSSDYSGGTAGFKLDSSGLVIRTGSIAAASLQIQQGSNLVYPEYADFESNVITGKILGVVSGTTAPLVSYDTAQKLFNSQSLKTTFTSNGYIVLGGSGATASDMMPVGDAGTYIVSWYIYNASGATVSMTPNLRYYDGSYHDYVGGNISAVSNSAWTRYSTTVVVAASWPKFGMYITLAGTGTLTFYMDGLQVEKKLGALNTPSEWKPPGSTRIDGGMIRTGSIISSAPATSVRTVPVYDSDGTTVLYYSDPVTVIDSTRPAWSVNAAGAAEFSDLSIKGNVTVGNPDGTTQGSTTTAATLTANTTNASTTVTATAGVFQVTDVGRSITGPGIPGGTTIASYVSPSTVTISAAATATATGITISIIRPARIVSSVSSADYIPGTQGWSIRGDGFSEFPSMAIGSLNGKAIKAGTIDADRISGGTIQSTINIAGSFQASAIPTALTLTTTSGSTTVTSAASDQPFDSTPVTGDVGVVISGNGIPASAVIATVVDAHTVTISIAATASNTTAGNIYRGRTVTMSGAGIIMTDQYRNQILTLPTDSTISAKFVGDVETNNLLVRNNLRLTGTTNTVEGAITMTLSTVPPTVAPTATTGNWDSTNSAMTSTSSLVGYRRGMVWDSVNSVFVGSVPNNPKSITSWNPSTGTETIQYLVDNANLSSGVQPWFGALRFPNGSCIIFGKGGGYSGNVQIYYSAAGYYGGLAADGNATTYDMAVYQTPGTYDYYTARITTGGRVLVEKWGWLGTVANGPTFSTVASYLSPASIAPNANLTGLYIGNADFGAQRIVVSTAYTAYVWDTGGVNTYPTQNWTFPNNDAMLGIGWDGTNFWARGNSVRGYKLSTIAANVNRTLTYTWYDSVGNTESTPSPSYVYTQPARTRMEVNGQPPSNSGTNTPNKIRIYVANQRQADLAVGAYSATYEIPATGGSAAPSFDGFSTVSTPGSIVSAKKDLSAVPYIIFNGDGSGQTPVTHWDNSGKKLRYYKAVQASGQTCSANAAIPWPTVAFGATSQWQIGGGTGVQNEFSVPYTGIWRIKAQVKFNGTPAAVVPFIIQGYISGAWSNLYYTPNYANTAFGGASIQTEIPLTAGWAIRIIPTVAFNTQSDPGYYSWGSNSNYFSFEYISGQ